MAGARHGFITLSVIAALFCTTSVQAFCFSFGSNSNKHAPYSRYAPPYPPPYPAMVSPAMQPRFMPGMAYPPVYPMPQQPPYGMLVPIQPGM